MAVRQQSFESVWPDLSARLKRVLQSRRVPDECVDDVIQETGLRLLRKWGSVEQSTIWSFTLTIAGNIIKDDMRRRVRDERFAESLPANNYVDIEERALARVELWKTHRAMESLSAVQRTALLTDVYGIESADPVNAGAAKMSRLRARRHLRQALGRASGLIVLGGHRLRRLMFGDPRAGLAESTSHTVAAALIIAAGVDLVLLGGGLFRSQPDPETGRVAMNATFGTDGSGDRASSIGSAFRSVGSATNPRFATAAGPHATGEPEEMLEHSEEVGTDGARSSLRSSLMGQRTSLDMQARRNMDQCQGRSPGRFALCVGSLSAEVAAHHNGKTYGARADTDGNFSVQSPYEVNGS